jgi:hypothetical protein
MPHFQVLGGGQRDAEVATVGICAEIEKRGAEANRTERSAFIANKQDQIWLWDDKEDRVHGHVHQP